MQIAFSREYLEERRKDLEVKARAEHERVWRQAIENRDREIKRILQIFEKQPTLRVSTDDEDAAKKLEEAGFEVMDNRPSDDLCGPSFYISVPC